MALHHQWRPGRAAREHVQHQSRGALRHRDVAVARPTATSPVARTARQGGAGERIGTAIPAPESRARTRPPPYSSRTSAAGGSAAIRNEAVEGLSATAALREATPQRYEVAATPAATRRRLGALRLRLRVRRGLGRGRFGQHQPRQEPVHGDERLHRANRLEHLERVMGTLQFRIHDRRSADGS